nr:MAG TPA: helix-turn-helix domain protein [Caudoviricetes sp.]
MFFDNYKEACKRNGITPTAAAKACGIAKSTVTGWKQGRSPRLCCVLALANFLKCNVNDLVKP